MLGLKLIRVGKMSPMGQAFDALCRKLDATRLNINTAYYI